MNRLSIPRSAVPQVLALVALVTVFVGASGVAAAPATAPAETSSDSDAAFPKGAEFLTLYSGYQNERTGEAQFLATVTGGVGHYFLDNAAIELQGVGYYAKDEEDGLGIGLNALARYHFINVGRFSLYGDVLGGIFWTSQDFPTGGTEFNFTYAGGPGLSYKLADRVYLNGGLRFQHVSNGFIEGRDRNPIFNSFGGYVGLMWMR